jgi:hypothetical protein
VAFYKSAVALNTLSLKRKFLRAGRPTVRIFDLSTLIEIQSFYSCFVFLILMKS